MSIPWLDGDPTTLLKRHNGVQTLVDPEVADDRWPTIIFRRSRGADPDHEMSFAIGREILWNVKLVMGPGLLSS